MKKDCETCEYGRKVEGNPFGSTANGFVSPFTRCTHDDETTPDYMYGGWCQFFQQQENDAS